MNVYTIPRYQDLYHPNIKSLSLKLLRPSAPEKAFIKVQTFWNKEEGNTVWQLVFSPCEKISLASVALNWGSQTEVPLLLNINRGYNRKRFKPTVNRIKPVNQLKFWRALLHKNTIHWKVFVRYKMSQKCLVLQTLVYDTLQTQAVFSCWVTGFAICYSSLL